MSLDLDVGFEVEAKPDGVFVAHYQGEALGGLAVAELLEETAPVKSGGDSYWNVPRYVDAITAQYGAVGVYEAMNSHILKAHKLLFGEAWPKAYISAQMIRYCVEPLTSSASMMGSTMTMPYDWENGRPPSYETHEELLELIGPDPGGVSPEDQFNARMLAKAWTSYPASEWIQVRHPMMDVPFNIRLFGTERSSDIKPPLMEPKLVWKEVHGKRVPLGNAEAGLETKSEPERLTYRDGTTGLIIAAMSLGVNQTWSPEGSFTPDQLPLKHIKKGTIPMEAPQVPLLAQASADAILNHPDFEELVSVA